ncbi:MAG: sulfotransferase family protein [Actinomycetota bacterium]|nr:sulfotransferase family protein [Actinomycetota bacterium]
MELPHTGTKAISAELRELYDGSMILRKHARYSEFLRTASAAEREYFTFSCIRNPLDVAVSVYFRYKTDHLGRYSERRRNVSRGDSEMFDFIRRTEADFPTYFRREYRRPLPYDDFSNEAHHTFDFIVRFENLQEDFATVLGMLGIEPKRSLPIVNRTTERQTDFVSYYPPELIPRARWVFGPYMEKWGYRLPNGWGRLPAPITARIAFRAIGVLRRTYASHLRDRFSSVSTRP